MPDRTGKLGNGAHLNLPIDEAIAHVTAALNAEGFGVLTQTDVQDTLREKLGEEFCRYHILRACNPPLAHKALSADLQLGLLLPCNVIVYEPDGGGSEVRFLDPVTMLSLSDSPGLEAVVQEARRRLTRVAEALTT